MGVVLKFFGGVIMTLVLVLVVPYFTDYYIIPYITEAVGDNTLLFFGSQTLIQILIFLFMILFMVLLGGGAVLRWCGFVGVIGMVVAYYLMGDVTKAIIPLISLTVVYIITIPYRTNKEIKKKVKAEKKELKGKLKEKRKARRKGSC